MSPPFFILVKNALFIVVTVDLMKLFFLRQSLAKIALLLSVLICFSGLSGNVMAAVTWSSGLGSISESWSGSGNINVSVTGVLNSVNGGAQNFGVKGLGSPAPATNQRYQLINQVGEELVIRRVRLITTSRTRTLRQNRWREGYSGGVGVGVTVDIRIRAAELGLTSPGDVYTGFIDICAGASEPDCDTASSESDISQLFITIIIPPGDRTVIERLDNFSMAINPGFGATGQDDFCIGTSGSSGAKITATSSNPSGSQFRLRRCPTCDDYIPYTVEIAGESFASGAEQSIPSSNSEISNLACDSDITSLVVTSTELDVSTAVQGSYEDTLMLLAVPE